MVRRGDRRAGCAQDAAQGSPVESVRGHCEPIVTLTDTPDSVPVSPVIANPAAFSATFTTSSVAIASRVSVSVPAACTVTV